MARQPPGRDYGINLRRCGQQHAALQPPVAGAKWWVSTRRLPEQATELSWALRTYQRQCSANEVARISLKGVGLAISDEGTQFVIERRVARRQLKRFRGKGFIPIDRHRSMVDTRNGECPLWVAVSNDQRNTQVSCQGSRSVAIEAKDPDPIHRRP